MIGKFTVSDWRKLLALLRDGILPRLNTNVGITVGQPGAGISLVVDYPNIGFNAYFLNDGIGWHFMAAGPAGAIQKHQVSGNLEIYDAGTGASADATAPMTLIFSITPKGHFLTAGATPTVAPNAGAGTGATALLDAGSTDLAGRIILNTGTGTTNGLQLTVTYATAFVNHPWVLLTLSDTTGSLVTTTLYVGENGTTTFTVFSSAPLDASKQYTINYLVVGH